MKLFGYTDRLSVAPGETIRFMVSSELPFYRAEIVRLGHGEQRAGALEFLAETVPTPADGEYIGRLQELRVGSYVQIPASPSLDEISSFSLQTWIYPTTPAKGLQGVITRWSAADQSGFGLFVDEDGCAAMCLGDGANSLLRLSSGIRLEPRQWAFVAASYAADSGQAHLWQVPLKPWSSAHARQSSILASINALPTAAPILLAAYTDVFGRPTGHFNGKIDSPRIFGAALEDFAVDALQEGAAPVSLGLPVIADWDLGQWTHPDDIVDVSQHRNHGQAFQTPTRAVTGRNWTGTETDFARCPREYAAIHFHDDDLDDAGWKIDFALPVPPDFPSGLYAARLWAGEDEDYVPFCVRPPRMRPSSSIAFLVPTLSHLAYANEHQSWENPLVLEMIPTEDGVESILKHVSAEDNKIISARLHSLYDRHSDGSGVCHSSRLRPLLNMRPDYVFAVARGPHQLGADVQLTSWLTAQGFEFDVFTDEDLHADGVELLGGYRVIVTGTHPEYWTGQMLDAMQNYLESGGRLMYLGGNGFYWVTSIDPHKPHVIEVRRGHSGTRTWASEPGENHHCSTGEHGGLWRHRGRAPQSLVGVGFSAQGLGPAQPYRRLPASHDPRVAFIFDGVPDDAAIGASGLILGGAAGFEIDRLDANLGSAPHALLLATATGFSNYYQAPVEDILMSDSNQGGSVNQTVRADMVYVDYPNGGAVFSVGSIGWGTSLSVDPHAARITSNVLRAFAAPTIPAAQGFS